MGADEIGASTFVTPQSRRLTVHDLLEALRKDLELQGKLNDPRRSLLARAEADFGDYAAIALTSEHIDAYLQRRLAEGDRPTTINRTTQLVGQAYRLAIKRRLINQAPHVRGLSDAGNERQGFFSQEEFDRVCGHLSSDLADFALFGYTTGWRKSEIASLTWQDVEDGVIRLRGENAKNGEARSVVIAGELSALVERREQARLVNGILTDRVFHRSGAAIKNFREAWITACVAAGLGQLVCPKCSAESADKKCGRCGVPTKYFGRLFHDFRRTGVRNMIRSGVPQNVAMKISGHKTASMFRRYDICNEDDLRAAMESVAATAKVRRGFPRSSTLRTRTVRTKKGQ